MEIWGITKKGIFIERHNRFEATVSIDGQEVNAHVPNSGRLKELLVRGAGIILRHYDDPGRKTEYGLLLVEKDNIWVSIDSANAPNRIVEEAIKERYFRQFDAYDTYKREVTAGKSRFDFGFGEDEISYYLEVKGVTFVEDGIARFPDAPTARGVKHLKELTELKRKGIGAGVIFIVQREDALCFEPNDSTDPDFGEALRAAFAAGVDMCAYVCRVRTDRIVITGQITINLE
jgi:sugar fermentation stimulation protein A